MVELGKFAMANRTEPHTDCFNRFQADFPTVRKFFRKILFCDAGKILHKEVIVELTVLRREFRQSVA